MKITLSLLTMFATLPLYAAETAVPTTESGSYYQCQSFDANDNQWVAKSAFELTATNKALEACKKESKDPKSCKTAKEYCEGYVNGISTRPMWQCVAFDQMAKAWKSNFYVRPDDAALGAKAYCQDRSALPATCYINMLTCKNLNEV
jgi:hypothetical protein